jgi:SAM-dependent methyltransferase
MQEKLKLYHDLASWFHLLTSPADYAEEAAFYAKSIRSFCSKEPRAIIELGSGGGNNASHMKAEFDLLLVDISPEMIDLSKGLNPECEHSIGDMTSLRLDRSFDAVFVHDAINYMTTESDLRKAMDTAFFHCKPGGAALFAPDFVMESFKPSTKHGGRDQGAKGLRYVEWNWDPNPNDTTYITDFAILLRNASGDVACEHDRHVMGIFRHAMWIHLLKRAGFQAHSLPAAVSKADPGAEVFIGVKPL